MAKPVKIIEVVYHDERNPYGGAAGDGSFVARFKATKAGKAAAETFASGRNYYGKPATLTESEVSRSAAQRYGLV
jgi:hypothetical protein